MWPGQRQKGFTLPIIFLKSAFFFLIVFRCKVKQMDHVYNRSLTQNNKKTFIIKKKKKKKGHSCNITKQMP